jgi:hypothetical protein
MFLQDSEQTNSMKSNPRIWINGVSNIVAGIWVKGASSAPEKYGLFCGGSFSGEYKSLINSCKYISSDNCVLDFDQAFVGNLVDIYSGNQDCSYYSEIICRLSISDIYCLKGIVYDALVHRESRANQLSEDVLNSLFIAHLNIAAYVLFKARPDFVVSTHAPGAYWDLVLYHLLERFGGKYIYLNESHLCGRYFISDSIYDHASIISPATSCTQDIDVDCNAFLDRNIHQNLFYISEKQYLLSNVEGRDKAVSELSERYTASNLRVESLRQLDEMKDIDLSMQATSNFQNRFPLSTVLATSFIDSRNAKYSKGVHLAAATRQEKHLKLLREYSIIPESLADSILILPQYSPEVNTVPMNGPTYHWSSLINIAIQIRDLSGIEKIYIKEHPAMLELNYHMKPRDDCFFAYCQHNRIDILNPFIRSTQLVDNSSRHVVVTGSSGAGVEFSQLGFPVISSCNPWWISLPRCYSYKDARSLFNKAKELNIDFYQMLRDSENTAIEWANKFRHLLTKTIDLGISTRELSDLHTYPNIDTAEIFAGTCLVILKTLTNGSEDKLQ